MPQDKPHQRSYNKVLSFAKSCTNESSISASDNDAAKADLAASNIGIINSSHLAAQAIPTSDFIYSQYETTLKRDRSEKPLQLIWVTDKTLSDPNRSPLLDSFISDATPPDTFIVKNLPPDPAHPQTGPKAHLPYRSSPSDASQSAPQNIVITARAFAVDRLNRIISTDREDVATTDIATTHEEPAGEQAKIALASYLESLRALKRRLRD